MISLSISLGKNPPTENVRVDQKERACFQPQSDSRWKKTED
jgi:hypothetical protein